MVITDHGILTNAEFQVEQMNSEHSIYEVIRVIDGIALFLEDHFLRLMSSIRIREFQFEMDFTEFKHRISELATLNQKQNGNVKFVLSFQGHECNWVFTFIPHSYPDPQEYLNGVATDFLSAERQNPNAKVIQNRVRNIANQLIADNKLYEVLLVDRDGLLTEGSRSNVFFVKDEVFYTSPSSQVLAGVTRLKVIECLKRLNYKLIEKSVSFNEISQFDAVFLTGTSPKILPVKSVGNHIFSTQLPCVNKLTDSYNILITEYIRNEKDFRS